MGKKKTAVLVGVVVLVVVAVAVYYFFFKPSPPQEITESTPPEESHVVEEPLQEEYIEPLEVELSKSDELVRKLAGTLSSHPALAFIWLKKEKLQPL